MKNKRNLMSIPRHFFERQKRERLICAFLGLGLKSVHKLMKDATGQLAREWAYAKSEKKSSPLYEKTQWYIFELEDWHIEDKMKQAGMIAIASQCRGKRFLEYGCGIGDTLILASIAGAKEVHGLDLPSKTLNYARFRILRFTKNKNIRLIDTSRNIQKLKLPQNYYDIISAEDIFEHVINPIEHAKKIYESLRKGGSMYFSTEFVHSDFHPMHLKSNERFHGIKWLYKLEKIGFKVISPCQAMKV